MAFYYSTPQDPLIAMIIDKEMHARQRLSRLLREIAPEFTGIAEAANDNEAVSKIERFTPDLIFVGYPATKRLLSEMDRGYAKGVPKVVLCKNVDRAQPMIDQLGGYFLRKPVDAQHLRDLLDSMNGFHANGHGMHQVDYHQLNGSANGGHNQGYLNRLVVRRHSQFRLLPVQKVLWFGTEYRLVYAYTEKRRYPIDLGLEQLEQRLDPNLFVRVHRSAIVNVSRIQEIIPTGGGRCKILLDDPQQRILPLSASRARMLKDLVKDKVNHH